MSNSGPFGTISEAELQPVLELIQGGDPDAIAERAGISREKLFQMRDTLLAQAQSEKAAAEQVELRKVGRNDPCPCGSGKKYKRCCLRKHEEAGLVLGAEEVARLREKEKEQQRLITSIEEAFRLLGGGKYDEAIQAASRLLNTYPNEDRLYDIVATSHMYARDCDEAVEICKRRWEVAKEEKAYFIEHGRYRDAEVEKPALSYYYPPTTWLQKYWIALKSRDYRNRYPEDENPAIVELVEELQTADDTERFPEKHDRGYEVRRQALEKTVHRLKKSGPEAIPYLLPLACRYCWAGLFVPEILSRYKTKLSIRSLIDVSMFGYAFSSGASLHYLEEMGEEAIPHIREAFARDTIFDPIKTGVVAVLGNIRVSASYDFLMSLLDHHSHHIVNWAGGALGKFGKVEALPRLLAARERIGGEKMIDAAVEELESLQAPPF
ncbi:MAG: SEC-C metal-binding domain-containing protein [Syntrophobacteria bacterium]